MRFMPGLVLCIVSMWFVTVAKAASITPGTAMVSFPAVQTPVDTMVDKGISVLPARYINNQKRLSLKQRLVLQLVKRKLNKLRGNQGEATPRQKRLGKLSLIFGIAAFAIAIIPILNILSIPAALTAIILGIISLKGNSNTNGIIGLGLGSLFFFLIFLLVVLLIAAFGGW